MESDCCSGGFTRRRDVHLIDSLGSRRDFVRIFALGTASALFLGKPWGASLLSAAEPANVGLLRIKISDYPPLAMNSGSVQLGLNPANLFGPEGFFYPITINHATGSTYHVLDAYCPHAGCVVPTYDRSEDIMLCPCHGSAYGIDGRILNGPTTSPLGKYKFTLSGGDTLNIEIPNLRFQVIATAVRSGTAQRLRLEFPTFSNIEYEVRLRTTLTAIGVATPFSLSASGPADQLSMFGNGSTATIFVNRTSAAGFYTVAVKVIDLT